jgi:hypothetical protein
MAIAESDDDDELDSLEGLDEKQLRRRLRTESMPGSYEDEGVLGRRAAREDSTDDELEQVESGLGVADEADVSKDDDEELMAGEMEDLDFSSVPVRP